MSLVREEERTGLATISVDGTDVGHASKAWQAVDIPRQLTSYVRLARRVLLLAVVLLLFVPWTQTITSTGRLSAFSPMERPQQMEAQIAANIARWHVVEGDMVRKGDLLVELKDIDPQYMAPDLIALLERSVEAARQHRDAVRERARHLKDRILEMRNLVDAAVPSAEARVDEARNKVRAARQQITSAASVFETATLNLRRISELFEHGLASQRELELAKQAVDVGRADLRAARASFQRAQQDFRAVGYARGQVQAEVTQRLQESEASYASAVAEAARANDQLASLELKLSNARLRRSVSRITAPLDGRVSRIARVGAGETVRPGDPLVQIAPTVAERAIEMETIGLNAPLLTPGRRVRLLFHGIPAIPIPAWPAFMAGTYEGVIRMVDPVANPQGNFRFWVTPHPTAKPWPEPDHVRQGTLVKGWVILNEVPLWYELWRRFNLFPPDYKQVEPKMLDILLPKAGTRGK